ncbi:unnamed protein product, partial [Durusdinium trenchii]
MHLALPSFQTHTPQSLDLATRLGPLNLSSDPCLFPRVYVSSLLQSLGHVWSAALFTKLGSGFVCALFRQLGALFAVSLLWQLPPKFSLQISNEMGLSFFLAVSATVCCEDLQRCRGGLAKK